MIEVVFNRGLYLPEMDFWLDPWDAKDSAFVSHAHADHFSRHGKALCSTVTAALLRKRFHMAEERMEAVDFGAMIERDGFRMRMLPAGHIVGSAMLHVTRKRDGASLLYTGDFKVRRGRTTEAVNFLQADTLIMETTFGLPNLVFPGAMEVDASVLRFVNDAFADGEVPVLFAYSLGKAQEAVALLAEHGIPVLSHPKVAEMTEVCRAVGVDLPEPVVFEGFAREGHVIVAPPNAVSAKILRGLKHKRSAMLTGWAQQSGSFFRYRVDEIIPMSDHADHPGLMECVTRVRPKRVLTVHGYSKEFAAQLREKGMDAWCAAGGDQLELSLGKSPGKSVGAASPRHIRPICQLADFSDVCRLISETSSRLAKVEYLVNNLRTMENDEDLSLVARWFSGGILPRQAGRRPLSIGGSAIKRALLSVVGVKPERYREISATQDDVGRTARMLLQEVLLEPKPLTLQGLGEFFKELEGVGGSLEKVELLTKRLHGLHPAEVETVVKLLTGDLRIGLKEELLEEAISKVFGVIEADVRSANMLTGDLGITSVLAKAGRLQEAQLTPLIPIRCMLAEDAWPDFSRLPFPSPFWLEPMVEGIRAQLHKSGQEVGLFSRDLRALDAEFPELAAAAKSLEGDFILDGVIVAYADGRRLGSTDLQKRLGSRRVVGDLFTEGADTLKFVAFDVLWKGGESFLKSPLMERRKVLEEMAFSGMFGVSDRLEAYDAEVCFKEVMQLGYGGLIVKDPQGVYSPGQRGGDLDRNQGCGVIEIS